jgi:hypothetical protein
MDWSIELRVKAKNQILIYLLLKTAEDKPDDKDDSSTKRYKTSSSNATGAFCYL